jgi:hypothetical protein
MDKVKIILTLITAAQIANHIEENDYSDSIVAIANGIEHSLTPSESKLALQRINVKVPADSNLRMLYDTLKLAEKHGLREMDLFLSRSATREVYDEMMEDLHSKLKSSKGGRYNKSRRVNRRNKRRSYRY